MYVSIIAASGEARFLMVRLGHELNLSYENSLSNNVNHLMTYSKEQITK